MGVVAEQVIVYKALKADGRSTNVGWLWPLPSAGKPSAWQKISEPPVLCHVGYHGWLSLDRAMQEGEQVWEMELAGEIVRDHEKAAGQRARLLRLAWHWEPEIVGHGARRCLQCGKPHDALRYRRVVAPQWADPADGHAYQPESWEAFVVALPTTMEERVAQYRVAAAEIERAHGFPRTDGWSYKPVVPASHGPWKAWEGPNTQPTPDACGTCGLPPALHEGWEERKALGDKYRSYDRWELLLLVGELQRLTGTVEEKE